MGPLHGIRVLEFAGTGPAPFCAMLLSDMGADVIRVDRPGGAALGIKDPVTGRGRSSVVLDLKAAQGRSAAQRLAARADVLLEGFRPGVMERLGLGPEPCLEANPRLIYGRMTGWGQDGPLARRAGHDINYIALSGALHAIGGGGRPSVPLNLIGDYGGGGMLLAFGVVCALLERQRSGLGQVVDAAMSDGASLLMALFYGLHATGQWEDRRGVNLLDGGAPFYDTYVCADGRHIAIGALEPAFYQELLRCLGLDGDPTLQRQMDVSSWPEIRRRFEEVFATRSRQDWCELFKDADICFAPVLGLSEAPEHPHHQARGSFIEQDGITQPAPAPRFSRSRPRVQGAVPEPGEGAEAALARWGVADNKPRV